MNGEALLSDGVFFSPGQFVQMCKQPGHPHSGRVGKIFCRQVNSLVVEISRTKQGDSSELVISPLQDWIPVSEIIVESYITPLATYGWRIRIPGCNYFQELGNEKFYEAQ